jgi:DNA-binding NarL/FixJ family response regulator
MVAGLLWKTLVVTARSRWQIRGVSESRAAVPTRVLIADDHESVRFGLRYVLSSLPDFEIVGEASSVATTLQAIDALVPQILVLDFGLGAETGDQVLAALAGRADRPRVLMFSMEDERVVGQELRRRGADAYLTKEASPEAIVAELRRLRRKLAEAQRAGAELMAPDASSGKVHITKREREVLNALMKDGVASKLIARRLRISEKTVDVHKHRLRRKLNLHSDLELARYAAIFVSREVRNV